MFSPENKKRKSFTLIELLVVLALVAILSVVVILTLNPAELIKQARDSNRLSDLSTINTALNLFSADVTAGFMGTSTIVYVSIPDNASSACGSLGLPTLPSGYIYNCVTAANLRNTNGTGWIPVNFQRISSNSPISQLPIDPINTTSTRLYYAYVSGGSWELNASIEASKNKLGGSGDLVSKDGGSAASLYEVGNNLNLNPVETGDSSLVGYWNFEEGPNDTIPDRSGYGDNGTWNGTSTTQQHYSNGKVGNYSGQFNGSSDKISTICNGTINSGSVSMWVKLDAIKSGYFFDSSLFARVSGIDGNVLCGLHDGEAGYPYTFSQTGQWQHLVFEWQNNTMTTFLSGVSIWSGTVTGAKLNGFLNFGYGDIGYFAGSLDDIHLYNRAFSAAEVLALYNATK